MVIKYNIEIEPAIVKQNMDRITNQLFKLLPLREEGNDWKTSLSSLKVDLFGLSEILSCQLDFFQLLCKVESLSSLESEEDFLMFRKLIFDCLGLMNELKDQCQD